MIEMDPAEFERAVVDALDSLPDEVARTIAEANVVILVREEPPPERHHGPGVHLLGLYQGVPLDQRSVFQGYAEPDRIFVFSGPLQRMALSREHLLEQIRVTVMHELGHLFGMSDARLQELGWG